MRAEFTKSSYCAGSNCVEVAEAAPEVAFERSSFCGNGACVEVDRTSAAPDVLVRDSKDLSIAPLRYTAKEWEAFVAGVKAGEFDA